MDNKDISDLCQEDIVYEGPTNAGYEEVNFISVMRHLQGVEVFGTQMAEFQIWHLPEYGVHVSYSRLRWEEIGGRRYQEEGLLFEVFKKDTITVRLIESAKSKRKEEVKELIRRAADHNPYEHGGNKADWYHPSMLPESVVPYTTMPHRD